MCRLIIPELKRIIPELKFGASTNPVSASNPKNEAACFNTRMSVPAAGKQTSSAAVRKSFATCGAGAEAVCDLGRHSGSCVSAPELEDKVLKGASRGV